eukprot:13796516-Alexandrium_andersonii.AAC.1
MSASLVGSEMCIRDSDNVPPPMAPSQSGNFVLRDIKLRELRGAMFRIPVSYTHLTLPTICSV